VGFLAREAEVAYSIFGQRLKYRTRTFPCVHQRSVGTSRSPGPSAFVVATSISAPHAARAPQSPFTLSMGPPYRTAG
jgi:hypothetical protein